jgi:4-amino-4-deoxy-L-arabinose transferase-like glycosyltransferase
MVAGAVIVLWLLICDQWKRLRPLYLPTGLLLFLAIALPWHLAVAARNPAWAHFYLIHEHFERFTTTEHGRIGPWWYFIPVVLLGIFPWTGFLWGALRDALSGGWGNRRENAEAWFLVIWAAFIFLFFSKSQSKLIPYILPVFPPLAVLIGRRIRGQVEKADTASDGISFFSLTPFIIFAGLCWLVAAAALTAVFMPGLIRDPVQAEALRGPAIWVAAALTVGGAITLGSAKRGLTPYLPMVCLLATTALMYGVLVSARTGFERRGTKAIALEAFAIAQPGERIYHYHEFFHDFTYYAQRTVGLVGYRGELEPQNDDPAKVTGQFIDDAEFLRQGAGPARVFAVARSSDVGELFASPGFHYRLLGETQGRILFSNR